MDQQEEINKELNELSPFLAKLKKEPDGFEVPHNYFKALPDEIMSRIEAEEQSSRSEAPGFSWLQQWQAALQGLLQPQYAMALASVVLLLVATWWWFAPNSAMAEQENVFATLSEEEILNYIDDHIDTFGPELVTVVEQADQPTDLLPALPIEDAEAEEYLDEILNELDDAELEELL
ncbi:MAG: hypothetical protein AAF798_17765 [Bacteroidota bacterium]